jgi:hypothetical protein
MKLNIRCQCVSSCWEAPLTLLRALVNKGPKRIDGGGLARPSWSVMDTRLSEQNALPSDRHEVLLPLDERPRLTKMGTTP